MGLGLQKVAKEEVDDIWILLKMMERTHEEATEALYAGREKSASEAASIGASSNLRIM